ncbi:DNA-binding XRE family transcriptional regulator [Pseudaminobacter salicylatoxidans]|uniref:DNA-binding XRE family transcriptional regulator n=1 Tax=Pseudaminobacter salicylatoxidans TaxID=93369 RepID=A0A316C0P5_PSESE|nr:helix-turn-helix domain-containing protein [Pseudaminobacter salicylatoxidans]PWJ81551.1 DNA-binding XRE family transcriptional regulator [Pseudaminobacter salicylatoxidans]
MKNMLKSLRLDAGLTQEELGKRVGATKQQIGRLEKDQRKLTMEWARKLATALGCSPFDLYKADISKLKERAINIHEVSESQLKEPDMPAMSIDRALLSRILPGISHDHFEIMIVESDLPGEVAKRGDFVILDTSIRTATNPGIYSVDFNGSPQLRLLVITKTGEIIARSGMPGVPDETFSADEISILGRAKLKISTI